MDLDLLRSSPVGSLIPISGEDARTGRYDYFAFLPNPLPEDPNLDPRTWTEVAAAMEAIGQLRQACAHLPNPQLLIAPALAREAVSTSALEGTFAPLSEILEARIEPQILRSPEVAEIRAYEHIAREAFAWVSERPISIGFLSEMQAILVSESRTPARDPGRVRQHQVVIGPEGCAVPEARFVPPPGDDRLRAAVEDWQAWVQADHELPPALSAAMAHYQFETVHPFGDGNGRIGRLVIILQLLRTGALPAPVLTVSPWLLRNRGQYQDQLLRMSQSGDWNPWVAFFCRALREQCEAHVRVIDDLALWIAEVREKINDRRWAGTILRMAEDLVDWPVLTMTFAANKYGVSIPTAKSAIDRLVEIDVLEELTGRRYKRIFGAPRVIELVESL